MSLLSIRRVELEPYRFGLVGAAAAALGAPGREGIVVRVSFADADCAHGDAAPLPDDEREPLSATREALQRADQALRGARFGSVDEIRALLAPCTLPSAAQHGLEQALLGALAHASGERLTRLLGAQRPPEAIETNALVDGVDDAVRAVNAGYRCLKLKVGRAALAADLDRIASVRHAVGNEIELRLDANGRWSFDTAEAALTALEALEVAYVEQPVSQLEALAQLRARGPVAVAADELCGSIDGARAVIARGAADLLVIKPMRCGGLLAARQIADLAREAEVDVVVTSSFESALGCEAALQLAAALPAPRRAAGLASSDPRWHQRPRMLVSPPGQRGDRA